MSNFTIQDIFLKCGDDYIEKHNLSKEQWKVFNSIRNCGTKELGYHICACEECGEEYFGYNHAIIDTVQCVKAMHVKSGFKKSPVIFLIPSAFISLPLFLMN